MKKVKRKPPVENDIEYVRKGSERRQVIRELERWLDKSRDARDVDTWAFRQELRKKLEEVKTKKGEREK